MVSKPWRPPWSPSLSQGLGQQVPAASSAPKIFGFLEQRLPAPKGMSRKSRGQLQRRLAFSAPDFWEQVAETGHEDF
jgi:hypothetical protein